MIVKIRCEEQWVIYDNFTKISYQKTQKESDVNATWYGQKGNSDSAILIIGKRWDDTEFSILANQDVYLCNDEGRTIEKIN